MTPARRAFEEAVDKLCQDLQGLATAREALTEARGAMRQIEQAFERASADVEASAHRVALTAAQAGIVGAERFPIGFPGVVDLAPGRRGKVT